MGVRARSRTQPFVEYDNPRTATFQMTHIQKMCSAVESFVASLRNPYHMPMALELLPVALKQAEEIGLKRSDIARRCQLSEATISRWMSGQVVPHVLMAQTALDQLRILATERVNGLHAILAQLEEKARV